MKPRIVACAWVAIFAIGWASDAGAAVWRWGCMGTIGNQQIIFNRYTLIIAPAKPSRGNLRDLIFLDNLAKEPAGIDSTYNAVDGNSGMVTKIEFTSTDDPKRKLTMTERSSKTISSRSKLICGRDEINDVFRKVYRIERDDEPARDITIQCIEYQLSTRGGRPCN